MNNPSASIEEDLKIEVGVGITMYNGRDSYPYYISEVLPNQIIGVYSANSHFEHDWTEGNMTVDKFNPTTETEFYIKRRYGKWWKVTKDGKPLVRWSNRWCHIEIGHASSYQDPSF